MQDMQKIQPVIAQRADPHLYLHNDGYYYFTASVPEYDRIELRRAKEIDQLAETQEIVNVWHKPEHGPYSDLIWAPEVHYLNQQWYIYFAAAPNREIKDGTFQHRMYVISNKNVNPLVGNWTLHGEIKTGIDSFCLDATVFTHQENLYYLWAQKHPTLRGNSCLYIAKMDTPTSLESTPVMISKPELAWEIRGFWVNEGPSVLKRNGYIFVSYSASATDENYCMGLLHIRQDQDLLEADNWLKSQQPVLQTSWGNKIFGPGHNSFAKSKEGDDDLLVYHARNYTEIEGDPLWDPNRHTYIERFHWDESGFPVFSETGTNLVN